MYEIRRLVFFHFQISYIIPHFTQETIECTSINMSYKNLLILSASNHVPNLIALFLIYVMVAICSYVLSDKNEGNKNVLYFVFNSFRIYNMFNVLNFVQCFILTYVYTG